MAKVNILDKEFHPLVEGEEIIKQYFVDNTPPEFNFRTFLILLFPTIVPAFFYLINFFKKVEEHGRIILTDKRFIYEKMRINESRWAISFDITQISSISCDYSTYIKKRNFLARLFGKKDQREYLLEWELTTTDTLLFSEKNILVLPEEEIGNFANSKNLSQELSGIVYQLKEKNE